MAEDQADYDVTGNYVGIKANAGPFVDRYWGSDSAPSEPVPQDAASLYSPQEALIRQGIVTYGPDEKPAPQGTVPYGPDEAPIPQGNIPYGPDEETIPQGSVQYGPATKPSRYTGDGISLEDSSTINYAGGLKTWKLTDAQLGMFDELGLTPETSTIVYTTDADGNRIPSIEKAPVGADGKPLVSTLQLDGNMVRVVAPKTAESSAAQSLYKSPQFMAPVTASVVNGLFQMIAAERMAKAQRDEQRRMLDAQFQVLEKKEEANEEKKRRFASIYASLQAERKGKGRSG
jgi:hypothetical protein